MRVLLRHRLEVAAGLERPDELGVVLGEETACSVSGPTGKATAWMAVVPNPDLVFEDRHGASGTARAVTSSWAAQSSKSREEPLSRRIGAWQPGDTVTFMALTQPPRSTSRPRPRPSSAGRCARPSRRS